MKKILISAIMVSVLIACSSTRITNSWSADNINQNSYKKILVLGLINEPDRMIREEMEGHLVSDLLNLGYDAVCSCDEFGPKSFERMGEKDALVRLNNSGIDAVLTVVLLDKEKERYYVPGRVYYSPYSIYHNRFWGYYTTMYERVYAPGYYSTNTRYFWESNFYDLKKGQELLYSVQSQSFDPESARSLGHEYGLMVVNDMVKKNLLSKQNKNDLKPM